MADSVPNDVITYLQSHRSFSADLSGSECGAVVLSTVNSLKAREFWVNGEGRDWPDDPHQGEDGYYIVAGVDLVEQIDGFDPAGILVWIPAMSLFGTWDCDHWDLILFEHTSWQAIVDNPVHYLDAQWNPDQPFNYAKPWLAGCEWRNGKPF